ncbi:MAG: hypothetical protein E6767_10510 [Dysgonomonas sp.]|nr:hypothetical protein [Dysgonomonas sp.]
MGLPRVSLNVAANGATDIDGGFFASLGITSVTPTAGDATLHEGLVVYNVATGTNSMAVGNLYAEVEICPGMYVWKGTVWERVSYTDCQTGVTP